MAQRRASEAVLIVALCVGAAVGYGIAHDQVTARISIEYFTIGHPRLFATDDPTPHALAWGVIATWWVGLLLGLSLAFAAQAGQRASVPARDLVLPVFTLLVVMACGAFVSGLIGYIAASHHWVYMLEPLASRVPASRHVPFLTDLWIHNASYALGFVGGVLLSVRVWNRRGQAQQV